MSLANAFETGRLYKPLTDIADRARDVYTSFLLLPGLRGVWPMSVINSVPAIIDMSGLQNLTVNGSPTISSTNGPSYITLNGTTDYLSRGDTADHDILGTETYIDASMRGLTVGGWFWANGTSSGVLIAKQGSGSNTPYRLDAGTEFSFRIGNGSTTKTATSDTLTVAKWYFVVGRFIPSTEIAVFANGAKSVDVIGIFSSLMNTADPFGIGARASVPDAHFSGRASLCFMCASALPDATIDNLFQVSRDLFGV